MKKQVNPTKLKNRYTGEVVYCTNIKEVIEQAPYNFIRVFKEDLPQRTYLVNKDAFELAK
jgi:hypothetical protein